MNLWILLIILIPIAYIIIHFIKNKQIEKFRNKIDLFTPIVHALATIIEYFTIQSYLSDSLGGYDSYIDITVGLGFIIIIIADIALVGYILLSKKYNKPVSTASSANTVQQSANDNNSDTRICPECKTENIITGKFCVNCGYDFSKSEDKNIHCTECGTENAASSNFCSKCGHALNK